MKRTPPSDEMSSRPDQRKASQMKTRNTVEQEAIIKAGKSKSTPS